jgi:hypothetical protein
LKLTAWVWHTHKEINVPDHLTNPSMQFIDDCSYGKDQIPGLRVRQTMESLFFSGMPTIQIFLTVTDKGFDLLARGVLMGGERTLLGERGSNNQLFEWRWGQKQSAVGVRTPI